MAFKTGSDSITFPMDFGEDAAFVFHSSSICRRLSDTLVALPGR